jgi:hypothetical protein
VMVIHEEFLEKIQQEKVYRQELHAVEKLI